MKTRQKRMLAQGGANEMLTRGFSKRESRELLATWQEHSAGNERTETPFPKGKRRSEVLTECQRRRNKERVETENQGGYVCMIDGAKRGDVSAPLSTFFVGCCAFCCY